MLTAHKATIAVRSLFHPARLVVMAPSMVLMLFVLLVAGRGVAAHGVDPIAPDPWDGALMMTPSNLEDEAVRADLIVVGRVVSQASRAVPGSIDTDVTVALEKTEKGTSAANVTFTVQGGKIGSKQVFVGGAPNFLAGERVLLFLRNARPGETAPHLVQLWQSKYTLAGSNAIQPESSTPIPITQLEHRLSLVLGKSITIGASSNTVTAAPFTTSCPAWAANQIPVPYVVNGSLGTNIMPESSFVSFIRTAWDAWTTQPGTSIRTSFSRTGPEDGTNHSDGVNSIAWGDVSSLGASVIGVNYCVSNGTNRIDSDTLISNSTSWDINPADGISGNQLSLYSVMVHELGHGIGIGHPCPDAVCDFNGAGGHCDPTAATPVMCPVIQQGVNKTIQQDDKDAVTSLYPASGGGGSSGPQPFGNLESPAPGNVGQTFSVTGWAIDKGATTGTGVDQVHVYVYPTDTAGNVNGAGQFQGQATYGGNRPDIAAGNGSQFAPSGFSFTVSNLAVGHYQLAVFYHSTVSNSFIPLTRLVNVTGPVSNPVGSIDGPAPGNVGKNFLVSGWAVDSGAPSGTGIDQVHIYVYPTNASGQVTGAAQFLGQATYGSSRPDIGNIFGSRFGPSGYTFNVSNLAVGNYQLTVFIHSTLSKNFTPMIRLINVTGPVSQPYMSIDTPGPGSTVGASFVVNGWALDKGAPTGTGVDLVHVYAYPADANGNITGAAIFLGQATYGGSRPDVGAGYGSQFTNSAYTKTASASGLATGNYVLAVYAHSTVSGNWNVLTRVIKH